MSPEEPILAKQKIVDDRIFERKAPKAKGYGQPRLSFSFSFIIITRFEGIEESRFNMSPHIIGIAGDVKRLVCEFFVFCAGSDFKVATGRTPKTLVMR